MMFDFGLFESFCFDSNFSVLYSIMTQRTSKGCSKFLLRNLRHRFSDRFLVWGHEKMAYKQAWVRWVR